MPDLFSKVSEILSDPEAARKIKEIASGLSSAPVGGSSEEPLPESGEVSAPLLSNGGSDLLSAFSGIDSFSGAHSRDLQLLQAMRPYLRASRAGKIDHAIKAIRVIDLLSALR